MSKKSKLEIEIEEKIESLDGALEFQQEHAQTHQVRLDNAMAQIELLKAQKVYLTGLLANNRPAGKKGAKE